MLVTSIDTHTNTYTAGQPYSMPWSFLQCEHNALLVNASFDGKNLTVSAMQSIHLDRKPTTLVHKESWISWSTQLIPICLSTCHINRLKSWWNVRALQVFYDDKPALAKSARPDIFCVPPAQRFCSTGKLSQDTLNTDRSEDTCGGRSGNRGEITRHPGESGSVYGVSTFVDDYARWGSKLKGMALSETERQKTTRYFDAW